MFKPTLQMITFLLISVTCVLCNANTVIEKAQECAMKNLAVACEKGDNIKFDIIRTHDQRGVVFLNVNTTEAMGDHLLLYINDNKPEILKMEHRQSPLNSLATGAFISRDLIGKLRSATSVRFKIAMKKRTPISGSLGEHHFDWLKRFGNTCS